MLACACPKCGATTPLSLSSPTVACRYCHFEGPAPDRVQQQLRSASEVLHRLDEHHRQLDATERRALSSSSLTGWLFALFALALCLPFVLLSGCSAYITIDVGRALPGLMLMTFAPLLLVVFGIALAALRLRRKRRALQLSCAAVPPEVMGGQAACHVCGGPLKTGTEAIARCGYCNADNLVAPDVLRRAGAQVSVVLDGFADEVRSRATSMRGAVFRAAGGVAALGCLAPVLGVGLVIALSFALDDVEYATHPEKYAVVSTPKGRCVAQVQDPGSSRPFLHFGNVTGLESQFRTGVALSELRDADFVLKHRVYAADENLFGKVRRVYGSWHGGTNQALVETDAGGQARLSVEGLCLPDWQGTALSLEK